MPVLFGKPEITNWLEKVQGLIGDMTMGDENRGKDHIFVRGKCRFCFLEKINSTNRY